MSSQFGSGVVRSPCFSNFLARTTFVLESLPEAKNPGQDAFLGHLDFRSSELMIIQSIYLYIVILGESKPDKIPGHSWLSFFTGSA